MAPREALFTRLTVPKDYLYKRPDESRDEFLDRRREKRQEMADEEVKLWARSPTPPPERYAAAFRDLQPDVPEKKAEPEPENEEKSDSSSSSSSSESDRKKKKKAKKRKRESKKSKKKKKKAKRKKSSSSSSSSSASAPSSTLSSLERRTRKEKSPTVIPQVKAATASNALTVAKQHTKEASPAPGSIEEGPKPITDLLAKKPISYGANLMPGEGQAYAKFVQENKRIPRRGEVGLNAEEIENFEQLGYVMSGSRHRRMNAIRIRKENQVYTAEEKRALAILNHEEKAKREEKIMSDFQYLLDEKLKKAESANKRFV
eukprot:TRINITY_DN2295_c0_g1_i1.p1 TRINITY_DN2295_c0_g1~~TRINITY_DN2295_c0_g1_i1.p1  ORF type:complete len:324 (-),score=81.12 TRINITY_DN2295_c0_g1_i1:23-973(-)